MDDNKVRVIKMSADALFEFMYEKFVEEQECYLDVDPISVINTFDIDWERKEFIFCAYNSEDSEENLLRLPEKVDLKKLMQKLPDTTSSMFDDDRYEEYTKDELEKLCE